ncbi:ISL3 family transposase [Aquipuribacter sp. MA13-6]|uniref:ISL3 family transposase n=1 Tax=unclassified Aquipuribacter TaxID=2635084 RepID=UPI003EE9DD7A
MGLPGVHVVAVDQPAPGRLRVVVETPTEPMGCHECGVVAVARGRREVSLVDVPCGGRAVRLVWRKRTWRCPEPSCPVGAFTEIHEAIARPRALLTTRAAWWALGQMRRENASVAGLARQLGTTWRTVWRAVKPLLVAMAADPARFDDVTALGVDEHVWHHVSTKPVEDGGRGPKELTGMVDLSRDQHGRVRARLLDLVPGRSGRAYADWLQARGEAFTSRVEVATLDPFHGYKNAIDDELEDATAVLDAFHVIKLGTQVVDWGYPRSRGRSAAECSRTPSVIAAARVTRSTASAPSCGPGSRNSPTGSGPASSEPSTSPEHDAVFVAWSVAQKLRLAYRHPTPAEGKKIAEQLIASLPSCPIPEVARLGRPLKQWRAAFLAYFDTDRASNGGTEAINGLIELHRRIARGFRNRDNYRLRMLLIGGGLIDPRL